MVGRSFAYGTAALRRGGSTVDLAFFPASCHFPLSVALDNRSLPLATQQLISHTLVMNAGHSPIHCRHWTLENMANTDAGLFSCLDQPSGLMATYDSLAISRDCAGCIERAHGCCGKALGGRACSQTAFDASAASHLTNRLNAASTAFDESSARQRGDTPIVPLRAKRCAGYLSRSYSTHLSLTLIL